MKFTEKDILNNSTTKGQEISAKLKDNILLLHEYIDKCPDIVTREIIIREEVKGLFIYVKNFIDWTSAQRDFINPLLRKMTAEKEDFDFSNELPVGTLEYRHTIEEILKDIFSGNIIFIIDGINFAYSSNFGHEEKRAIEEPSVEKNVRGSHDGFIENMEINIAILRKKIKNVNLKFETHKIGTTTNQTVAIAYVKGIANDKLLERLSAKIANINYDGLIGIGYVEQFITDRRNSYFPQYQCTERPDKTVAALLEGRFVLLLDGTPVVLIVPVTFFSFFQAPDDFNFHWIVGSFYGELRLVGMLIAIFLPAIYIAILTYNYYMVPLNLIVPLAESRSKVPFPPVVEALLMESMIEMLREAAVRLPTYVSSSIGIVGGIVLGQAAVEAGIVSNLMVLIVSVTAIASFIIPSYDMGLAIRLTRFAVMIMASIFGIIGVTICFILLMAHLLSLESLGQPYFQPLIPLKLKDIKGAGLRLPLQLHKKRPNSSQPKDKIRGK